MGSQGPSDSSDMTRVADTLQRPPTHAADEDAQTITTGRARRRLERFRFWTTAPIVILVLLALLWLAALTEPGNGAGVVILELLTCLPLALMVRWRRKLTRKLRELPAPVSQEEGAAPAAVMVAPPLRCRAVALPDLTVRPRLVGRLAATVIPTLFLALLLKLSYDDATFDPRIPFFALQVLWVSVVVWRARLIVAQGVLWRRRFIGYTGVELGALAEVKVLRANPLKQEGIYRTMLEVRDRAGHVVAFKPALWTHGARPLIAGLATIAQHQALDLDEVTHTKLDRAASKEAMTPPWAFNAASWPVVASEPPAPQRSTFWIRRDDLGQPKKAQPQLILPVVAILAASVPVLVFVGRTGTQRVRDMRCRNDRHLWAADTPAATSLATPLDIANRIRSAGSNHGVAALYRLQPSNLANAHNTPSVRRDAQALRDGYLVEWSDGSAPTASVYVERFDTASSAARFHRDYAEDHCHVGDIAFATPSINGGMGFRCSCTDERVFERVAFVRGAVRVQAIAWNIPAKEGHDRSIALAALAARSF